MALSCATTLVDGTGTPPFHARFCFSLMGPLTIISAKPRVSPAYIIWRSFAPIYFKSGRRLLPRHEALTFALSHQRRFGRLKLCNIMKARRPPRGPILAELAHRVA